MIQVGIFLTRDRPRLVSCKPEYWTGYRAKHRDSPYIAGSLSLDYEPYRGMPHVVVPVVTVSFHHDIPPRVITLPVRD